MTLGSQVSFVYLWVILLQWEGCDEKHNPYLKVLVATFMSSNYPIHQFGIFFLVTLKNSVNLKVFHAITG